VLYQPQNVEKIVAWGGFASIKHVSRYIQPGVELVSFDPKRSASVIGPDPCTVAGNGTCVLTRTFAGRVIVHAPLKTYSPKRPAFDSVMRRA